MRMNSKLSFGLLAALLLTACSQPQSGPTITPVGLASTTPGMTATQPASPEPEATLVQSPSATLTPAPADTAEPAPTATPADTVAPTPSATVTASPVPFTVLLEPTATPSPGDARVRVSELPVGEPGNVLNITFGYWLRYPADWYTGFGQRPLLASFSNLNPGTHNRNSMRAEGCLIEVNASTNIYGFGFDELISQLPLSFPDAEQFELDGQPAFLVKRSSGDNPFDSEAVYVEHEDRLFVLTFDYSRDALEVCSPAWQGILQSWQWFSPRLAVYRNPDYGYAVSHPASWYRFNAGERGISVSSTDPTDATGMADLLAEGMVCQTDVMENANDLPLRQWLAAQDLITGVTDKIEIDGLLGMRVIRPATLAGVQELSGYYQGPLGSIYSVTCLYPDDQQKKFRPIANAIIFSFEF